MFQNQLKLIKLVSHHNNIRIRPDNALLSALRVVQFVWPAQIAERLIQALLIHVRNDKPFPDTGVFQFAVTIRQSLQYRNGYAIGP